MILAKKKKRIFNLNKFVNAFLNRLGSGGTLIIPAYSWDFIKKKTFIVILHLNLSVAKPIMAKIIEIIQNLITTVDSGHPFFSK